MTDPKMRRAEAIYLREPDDAEHFNECPYAYGDADCVCICRSVEDEMEERAAEDRADAEVNRW